MLSFRVAAADLIVGARCAGCGRPAITLCRGCAGELRPEPRRSWPDPVPRRLLGPSPVVPYAAGVYQGALRSVLAAYKEHGQFGLLPMLSHFLAASICAGVPSSLPIAIVPIPSSRWANLHRGHDAVGELAAAAAAALRRIGVDCRAERALTQARAVADQSGLSAADRSANLQGALRARGGGKLAGREVVVVDDILTTGATAAEAVRALGLLGVRPVAIAVVAATARRRAHDAAEAIVEKSPVGGYGQ